jgi:hypothetical protein
MWRCAPALRGPACCAALLRRARAAAPRAQAEGDAVGWTSGALFGAAAAADAAAADAADAAALAALRYAPGNPRVFLDVEINGQPAGRVRACTQPLRA